MSLGTILLIVLVLVLGRSGTASVKKKDDA